MICQVLAEQLVNSTVPGGRPVDRLTAELRWPVVVRALGTIRTPAIADRRCCRPDSVVTGTQKSDKYTGAAPC